MIEKSERTPKRWTKECLLLANAVHQDYYQNKAAKGIKTEFIREICPGLWGSLNFIRIRQTYSLCYALTLTPTLSSGALHCPWLAGSRFDQNFTLYRAFEADLGLAHHYMRTDANFPKDLWSFGEWRSNTLDFVGPSMRHAETHLLPYYLSVLAQAAGNLLRVFESAAAMFAEVTVVDDKFIQGETEETTRREIVLRKGISFPDLEAWRPDCINLRADDIAHGKISMHLAADNHLPDYIVLWNLVEFWHIRGELPRMIATVQAIREIE